MKIPIFCRLFRYIVTYHFLSSFIVFLVVEVDAVSGRSEIKTKLLLQNIRTHLAQKVDEIVQQKECESGLTLCKIPKNKEDEDKSEEIPPPPKLVRGHHKPLIKVNPKDVIHTLMPKAQKKIFRKSQKEDTEKQAKDFRQDRESTENSKESDEEINLNTPKLSKSSKILPKPLKPTFESQASPQKKLNKRPENDEKVDTKNILKKKLNVDSTQNKEEKLRFGRSEKLEFETKNKKLEKATDKTSKEKPKNEEQSTDSLVFPGGAFFFVLDSKEVKSDLCRKHSQIYLKQLKKYKIWALMMYDASAKLPSGILQGNTNQYGDFDECLSINAVFKISKTKDRKPSGIKGKYCLANVDITTNLDSGGLREALERAESFSFIRSTISDAANFIPRFSTLNWGLCVPSACPAEDVEKYMKNQLEVFNSSRLFFNVKVEEENCVVKDDLKIEYDYATLGTITKIPEGILYGSSHNLGNFDECVNVAVDVSTDNNKDILKGQYCLAKVSLSGLHKRKDESDESYYPLHSAWGTLKVPTNRREFRKDVNYWTFCVPSGCTSEDIQEFLNSVADTLSIRGLELQFNVSPDMCQVKKDLVIDGYDIALGVVFSLFITVVAVATAYDLIVVQKSNDESRSLKVSIALCFSAYTNFVKLSAYTPSVHNLDSIFGIKAITMVLILMGHASAFLIGGPSMNSNFKEEAVLKVENALLLNNPLLVDTFLMIGAFLLCRLLLAELEKKKFVNPVIVYIARIIRLTPAYAVVIAIYCTWLYKFDSGPLWEAKIGLERERCRKSWWVNLLYINNYVNNDYLCMFQSWYLAVDTHFFFLAPGIIYPLYKWPLVGEIILFVAMVISIIIPFVVTFIHHLDPVLMMYASEITDLSANPMYKFTYIKTHMRGMSYIIGIFLGYVIHKIQSSGYKVPKTIMWCGWIIGTFASISAMFTVSVFYYRPYDAFESATYAALHRVGWCVGIAWVIFACVTNNADKLDRFLSSRIWVPISRLSYCAYLTNGLVELHTIGTLRHTRYLTNLEVAKETMSHITLTYGIALVLSILFEAPILGIESLLLKKANHTNTKKPMGSSTVSVESQSSVETSTTNSSA